MNILLYIMFPVLFLLSSCSSQSPAPIEYNYQKSRSSAKKQLQNKLNENLTAEGEANVELSEERYSAGVKSDNLKTIYHQVKVNEDLSTIAKNYEQTVEEVAGVNNLPIDTKLSPGQLVRIKVAKDKLDKINTSTSNIHEETDTLTSEHLVSNEKQLVWPVDGRVIEKFGENVNGKVKVGINIEAPEGRPIKSVGDGIVMHVENNQEFGNFAIIKLNDSTTSVAYAYMKDLELQKGQNIKKGQVIGHIGMTGKATKPQLYLAIREGKKAIDPEQFINH